MPVERALRKARLPTSTEGLSHRWISYAQMRIFLDEVTSREGLPDLGWEAAMAAATESLADSIRCRILAAPTLLAALECAATVATSQSTHLRVWLERSVRGGRICHDNRLGPEVAGYRITEDHTQGALLCIVRSYLGNSWRPDVLFARHRQATTPGTLSLDGEAVEVRGHGHHGGFDIPVELLRAPRRTHTPTRIAAGDTDPPASIEVALRELVLSGLHDGPLPIGAAAQIFRCSVRSLQRELDASNSTYSAVVTRARLEAAMEELTDPRIPVTEVALKLGYSDHSAFTRAFKRLTGVPPRRYQARQMTLQG